MKLIVSLSLINVIGLLLVSCHNDSNEVSVLQGQVEFSISAKTIKNSLKTSKNLSSMPDLSWVVLSIKDINGKIITNSDKIELYNSGETYFSKPVTLNIGYYRVTRFCLLDWKDNVVYSAPLIGSKKALLVKKALPIEFNIKANDVTRIAPEVLSVIESKSEDFGYYNFGYEVVKTFDFLVRVFIFDDTVKEYKLTNANISISHDATIIYNEELKVDPYDSIISVNKFDSLDAKNKITLPEYYSNYTLALSKRDYKTYKQNFTKEELKQHFRRTDKGPLVIILHKNRDSTVIDIDRNIYKTVQIGTQTWMAENLKTTRYNDSTAIPNVRDAITWTNLVTPAYCWYNNDTSIYKTPYGALYNWYAVNTSKLCPTGWHVPTDEEWTILDNYLINNGYNYDDKTIGNNYAKALASTSEWFPTTINGTVGSMDYPEKRNATHFTGMPGGCRYGNTNGAYSLMGSDGVFWSTSEYLNFIWSRAIFFNQTDFQKFLNSKANGSSVRCLRD